MDPGPWRCRRAPATNSSPGHFDPIDLTLRPSGSDLVADRNDVTVRVSGPAVQATRRDSGKGIRLLTPSIPRVEGQTVTVSDQGVTWRYAPTAAGLEVSARVTQSEGKRTYTFAYQLLGGARDLSVDTDGNLVSDSFVIPRSMAISADVAIHPAGAWRPAGLGRVAFDLDDTGIAAPYTLDPSLVFTVPGSANDDGSVGAFGPTYPPTSAPNATLNVYFDFARLRQLASPGDNFQISNGLERFDTTTLPVNAIVTAASLNLWNCAAGGGDNDSLVGDWVPNIPLSSALYSAAQGNIAISALPLASIPPDGNGGACLFATFASTARFTVPLKVFQAPTGLNAGIANGSFTDLRLEIGGVTPPTTDNIFAYVSAEGQPGQAPQLNLTYLLAPSAVTAVANQDGTATVHWTNPVQGPGATDTVAANTVLAYNAATQTFSGISATAAASATSATISGLAPGTQYYFYNCATYAGFPNNPACDNIATDDHSNTITTGPPAPTLVSPPLGSQVATLTPTITWSDSDPTGIAGYSYSAILDQNPSVTPPTVITNAATSASTSGATTDGIWYFHIRAENNAGIWGPAANFPINIAGSHPTCVTCTATNDTAGLENFYPYTPFNLGTGQAYANMATGNLVAQYTDLNVPGQGLNLRLTRTYNATLDTPTRTVDGPLGKGWTLGVAAGSDSSSSAVSDLLGLNLSGFLDDAAHNNTFRFTDTDGTTHTFVLDTATNVWASPPGVNLVLTRANSITGYIYTLTRPDGVAYTIQLVGLSSYRLTSITDRLGNRLCFNYVTVPCVSGILATVLGLLNPAQLLNPQLLSVTDANNRSLSFTYDAAGHLSETDFQATAGGPVLRAGYHVDGPTDRLTSVTEATGTVSARTTSFGYSGSPGLVSASDALTPSPNHTMFAYDAVGRIATLTDRANQPWVFTYGGSCTAPVPGTPVCLKDPNLNVSTFTSVANNLVDRQDAGDVDLANHVRLNQATYGWQNNRLVTATDEAGNATSYAYNGLGQITQSVLSGPSDPSTVTNLFYVTSTASASVADLTEEDVGAGTPQVRRTFFSPNPNGTLASVTDPGNNVTHFTYYPAGATGALLKAIVDPNGVTTTYGDPAMANNGYDVSGRPLKITDAQLNPTTFTYDYLGNPTATTNRDNQTSHASYDPYGRVTQTVSPLNESTLTCYDGNGDVVLVVSPRSPSPSCSLSGTDGFSTRSAYDPRGLLAFTLTTVDGQISKTTYDYYANGQKHHVTEPRSFDASGNLLSDPTRIAQVTYTYYADDRLKAGVDETGAETDAVYTPNGLPALMTAPAHDKAGTRTTTTSTYNDRGQVKTSQVSGVSATVNGFDLFGEVTATTTPNGNTTNFTFYPTGLPQTTTFPDATTATNVYDPARNLISLTQPTGAGAHTTVNYTYTALHKVLTETDPADATHGISYAYDPEGRQLNRFDSHSGVTETTQATLYDTDGRPVTQTATSTTGAPTHQSVTSYDTAGNVTGVTTTLGGVAISTVATTFTPDNLPKTMSETLTPTASSAVTRLSTYGYLNNGALAARGFDGVTTTYGYDLAGNESSTLPWTGGSFTTTYFPSGDLRAQTLPNGAQVTQTFDAADRLTSRFVTKASGEVQSSWSGATYDNDGNIRAETVFQENGALLPPTSYTGPATWGYDTRDRMTSYRGPTDPATTTYGLDDAGNVTTDATVTSSYTANRLNTRTPAVGPAATFGYDHQGNQATQTVGSNVTTTTYDAAFHPLRVTTPGLGNPWVQFSYDGLGRLAERQDNLGNVEMFFHDATSNQVAEEVDVAAILTTKTIRYLLDASGAPVGQTITGGPASFMVTDPHGSVALVLDATGAVVGTFGYDPFGNPKAAQTTTAGLFPPGSKFQFQGSPVDDKLGVYTLGARLYDPQINRFTGADLYASAASGLATQVDPLTGNRYLYAGANPAGLIDDGYSFWSSFKKAVSKVVKNPVVRIAVATAVVVGTVVGVAAACAGSVGFGCPEAIVGGVTADSAAIATLDEVSQSASAVVGDTPAAGAAQAATQGAVDGATPVANGISAGDAGSTLQDVVGTCDTNSFTGPTQVLLSSGEEVAISEVKVGDKVLATDPQTRKTTARPVTNVISHGGEHTMVDVTLADGTELTATDHHPFWDVTTSQFVHASDLHVGDELLGVDGRLLAVAAVRNYGRNVMVFNLTVSGIHTYYAGSTPVLVHNSCPSLMSCRNLVRRAIPLTKVET